MRLLNVKTFEFTTFLDEKPKYVAASHRWASGHETTFKDIRKRRNTESIGYKKVEAFARYVRDYVPTVEWLWIDTCCINQEDAAELSQAVNLMFKWYRDAEMCIAYLADVPAPENKASFEMSEWFRRGWTLQELLAPRVVVFLSQDWQIIGHKSCDTNKNGEVPLRLGALLNASIARVTSISETILGDFERGKIMPVEERLGWMSRRKTTREEDMSYCLLGIFDAPIGANYGEGGDRARKRLLAEVYKGNAYLEAMPVARGAAFDDRENELVSECLPDTRINLLLEIDDWASSKDGACVLWLSGMAGTGKSTIFRTIAQRFKDQYRLAASFCFKKGEADRGHASRVITTLSAQLARQWPSVRERLISVLEQDSDVVRKSLKEQFQRLILKPLEQFASPPAHGAAWIIGIDALDECDNESDIGTILDLLARLKELKSANFRLFVTGRPDLPLRSSFSRMPKDSHVNVRLEDVSEDVIAHDIDVYLRRNLAEIRSEYVRLNGVRTLRQDWPGDDVIENLVRMAQPLFIFAATVCRLLRELDEDPEETLRAVLERQSETSSLNWTYKPVLDRLLLNKTENQQEVIANDFRIIVGAVVLLREPLPIQELSRLLDVSEAKIRMRLNRLHSVLDIPAIEDRSRAVRPLHLSFRDYLTDPDTRDKSPIWIDETQTNHKLAKRCLSRLQQPGILRYDICGVQKPGSRRAEVNRRHVTDSITADVAYACSYWVWHLAQSGEQLRDNDQVHQFLQCHLLHWLEVLSWLGKLSGAIAHMSTLQTLVKVEQGTGLLSFLDDARRFVLRCRYITNIAPLQLYSSALIFAPTQSIVRQQFDDGSPSWLAFRPHVVSRWSAEIQELEGHDSEIAGVAFSPDNQTVVSGSWDKTVRLWNARTGEETQKLEGHSDRVRAVAFSPDGQIVASGSHDWTVRLWNAHTGGEMKKLEGHNDFVTTVSFSPDGQTVASGSHDRLIRVWDTHTGEETQILEGHADLVRAVAFSPDSQIVASGSHDRTVRLWNARTGGEMKKLEGHNDFVTTVSFSPDGQTVASGSHDRTVRLWNARTGKEMQRLEGHSDFVIAVAFSPEGQTVASGSCDRMVRLWDARTGEETQKLEGHDKAVTDVAFSPDGLTVASGSHDGTVRLWNARTREETQKLDGHNDFVTAVSFSPDGQMVVSGSWDKTVRLWNARTGEETQKLEGHSDRVRAVAFSPDGQTVASGSQDWTVRLWDAHTGKEMQKLEGHGNWIIAIAFFPDGQTIVSWSRDKTVRLWSTRTGEEIWRLEGHRHWITAVAFSLDGQTVASGSRDRTVRLWSTRTGEETWRLEGHCHWITTVAFSPDGQTVASGSRDRTVRLWNTRTGEQTRRLEGHSHWITAVAFSPDGETVASGSDDRTVRLWNAKNSKEVHQFQKANNINWLAFDMHGTSLRTNTGTLDVRPYLHSSQATNRLSASFSPPPPPPPSSPVALNEEWVGCHGQDLLWLPHEYRGTRSAVYQDTLVIGQASGGMSFLRVKVKGPINRSNEINA